jgi:hypothetical protein
MGWTVGVRIPVRKRFFSALQHPDRLGGPHSLLSNLYLVQSLPGANSVEVKLLGGEVDHSSPSSAAVKNGVAIPPSPPPMSQ